MSTASTSPRYPLRGVVSWNMNTSCNYRCSYCTQRFVEGRAQWARDLDSFLAAFATLPGDWEIKLSGGEPFRHPRFLDAVSGLVAGGLRVSVVTNLSASRARLQRYAAITAGDPGLLSASLHPEQVEIDDFIHKLAWFKELHAGPAHATCVATRSLLPQLGALQARFAAQGLRLKLQPEKQDREVIAYTPAEQALLTSLGGHNGTGLVAPDLSGRACWAGARYFVADHRGVAWRCYPARRYRREALGNLLDGSLALNMAASPCPYRYCNCTVPQQRGMVHTGSHPCSLDA